MDWNDSVMTVKGVGPKTAALMGKLGITTVGELLEYYPVSYDSYEAPVTVRQENFLDFAAVQGTIITSPSIRQMNRKQIVVSQIRDRNGDTLRVIWFHMPFLRGTMKPGMQFVLRGRLHGYGSARTMEHPQIFTLGAYDALIGSHQPIYALTAGLTSKTIGKAVSQVWESGIEIEESLSQDQRERWKLMNKKQAIQQIHFPQENAMLQEARKRLVFEEFYQFILGVRQMRQQLQMQKNIYAIIEQPQVWELMEKLPYRLTNAQRNAFSDICSDMIGEHRMNRLVQGDVGSGKTIVAFLALYQVALCRYQAAMMAPTEVLATQHYEALNKMIEQYELPIQAVLLTGSMTAAQKRAVYKQIESHEVDIIIGTHALFQEKVNYDELALVVTDEQHRFGVEQRKMLSEKGLAPHILVMSATPIPRTLAIIIYGDLDISVIDELPSNRLPIKNCAVDISYRPKAYEFLKKQVELGHQAYVICPMIEETEQMDAENVIEYTKKLRKELPANIVISYLHGKMKNSEKERIMKAFGENQIQILVSTTVIEVGIDVPNATVILIENAQQFGLAQLHQLRGRVGRGNAQSYCILMNTSGSKESRKRLDILNHSNDGFFIASEDLKLRGPGDFFGVRQSGMLQFKLADIYQDAEILKQASEAVEEVI
ncbi:MAG TPA: ATP-dependent DNA helicase RecG [Candidatus Fimimorpha faecalis]|uniref:ATP-dependent DNA helicase RecG n=1 Tax=Candidatus Fimimorpha faecalis TaxID=2840824 RepID=A0A9D1ECB8_9FIRM|nr:ATP-dependent DNA helicase RecG [Candidatus Fimimorpha faecalis]